MKDHHNRVTVVLECSPRLKKVFPRAAAIGAIIEVLENGVGLRPDGAEVSKANVEGV